MSDNQSEKTFSISIDVTFTQFNRKHLVFESVSGVKLANKHRPIFPRLLTYQAQEIKTLINKSLDQDLLMSKKRARWLIRDILKHPVFVCVSLFSTRRFTIHDVKLKDLPVRVNSANGDHRVWVSRHSIKSGISPSNLDESLEYDRLRNPWQFSALVMNCQSENDFESSKLYRKFNYSFFLGHPKNIQGYQVEYERFKDAEILHGRIATVGHQILQVSNVRKELIRREPMYLQESGEKLAVLDTFKELPPINEGIFFGSNLNWFHFIVECLTRYCSIPEHISREKPIVLESGVHANIVELCRILSSEDPVLVGPGERLPMRNLLLCRELGVEDPIDSTPRISNLLEIRKRVWRELGATTTTTQSHEIYYFRRKSKLFRPLQNENELIKLLKPVGVKFVYPEDLTISELVELLFRTKIIIIESGAAITNLMFAPIGLTVIELTPPSGKFGFWEKFLRPFGINYVGVVGTRKYIGRKGIASDGYSIKPRDVLEIVRVMQNR
jgi:hypothetical protein